MKKSILFLACAAILSVGCAKIDHEEVTPEKGKRHFTLRATVDEPGTRLSVSDNGKFSWQQDDPITVLAERNGAYKTYSLDAISDGPTGVFEFYPDEEDETISYVMYPDSENSCYNTTAHTLYFGLDARHDYVAGSTYMPMLGSDITVEEDVILASFKAVGGVLKVTLNNVPQDEEELIWKLVFAVPGKKITGQFPIKEDSYGVKYIETENYEGTDQIEIENNMGYSGDSNRRMDFYIPLPCGTYNNMEFTWVDVNDNLILSKTAQIDGGLIVHRNEVITAPTLSL